MGFLDKLLGRGKEAAQDVGDATKDVGDEAEQAYEDVKERGTGEGESEVAQSEQRLDEVRDEAARREGKIP
jgi:hypothetical protein